MLISLEINIQPSSEAYEKNVECTLPKGFIRGIYRPHTPFCC